MNPAGQSEREAGLAGKMTCDLKTSINRISGPALNICLEEEQLRTIKIVIPT
jgi:hypothetical protein